MAREDCPYCQLIADRTKKRLYEDDKVIAILNRMPSAYGHILVMPKEHYPIFEQVPDFIVSHCFIVVNKLSMAVFEALNIQGTNVIVHNGIEAGQESAHFMINIIPRMDGDGLNMQWASKKVSDEEMSIAELQIKEETDKIGQFDKPKEKPLEMKKEKQVITEEQENYLIKQLRRMP